MGITPQLSAVPLAWTCKSRRHISPCKPQKCTCERSCQEVEFLQPGESGSTTQARSASFPSAVKAQAIQRVPGGRQRASKALSGAPQPRSPLQHPRPAAVLPPAAACRRQPFTPPSVLPCSSRLSTIKKRAPNLWQQDACKPRQTHLRSATASCCSLSSLSSRCSRVAAACTAHGNVVPMDKVE